MKVIILLGALVVALVVLIPLLERSKVRISPETTHKLSRVIFPLVIASIVISIIYQLIYQN